MSEYAEIKIGKLSLYMFRNYLQSDIVGLFFSKSNLVVNKKCNIDDLDKDAGTYKQYVYKTTVQCAKERLDARGYGMENFEKIFDDKIVQAIDYSPFLNRLWEDYDENDKKIETRIRRNVSFRKWKNSMKKIICYEVANGNIQDEETFSDVNITTECDKIIFYSIKESDNESFYGIKYEIIHYAYIYRLILEYCQNDMEIILDFSNLAEWADDCIPKALKATEEVEKIIVLVEGTSDKDILEFAMSQLYPHLSDLFYFMDFEDEKGGKRDGGTSFLVKNLKTFYFSKIKTKFIAIFDNDAEGYSSKCSLLNDIKSWPENFRILLYPELKVLRKYPTISPNGSIIYDDINKKAASIELYLPDHIIKSNEEYYPIEWESRRKIKKNGVEEALYQGVISHKDEIKHKFHKERNKIENRDVIFVEKKWKRMKKLLETIVFAFDRV